jgi:hypothetical protein
MALTSAKVLRERILSVLCQEPSGSMDRSQVLERMDSEYKDTWSYEDLQSPKTRPFESKWENRASFERAKMVRDGILLGGGDGRWTLTATGWQAASAQDEPS